MSDLILNKKEYTLKTEEGKKNLLDYVNYYNTNRVDVDDPINKKIGIEEALAITNIEEFIRNKSSVAEIIREALEIAFTTANFKTNSVFTFTRKALKKLNLNSIIRVQIENYIKFRMSNAGKNIEQQKKHIDYNNITCFTLNGEQHYYNIMTNEELTGEDLKDYKDYLEGGFDELDALPF